MLSDNLGPHDDVALLEVGHLNELQIPFKVQNAVLKSRFGPQSIGEEGDQQGLVRYYFTILLTKS